MKIIKLVKPWLRLLKYKWLQHSAEYKARESKLFKLNQQLTPIAFIIGCGRSGTTILGKVFSQHPDIGYFFEPYHLWSAINPRTDVLNFYHQLDAYLLMNASHWDEKAEIRFNHVFLEHLPNPKTSLVIEKTPLNAMRIGYLNALAPKAKFIHIVRDGVDVAYSIERIALTSSYKIASQPQLNQWWGVRNYKWEALSRDGVSAGYYPDDVAQLYDHRSKGAYEWLVSLGEVDRWRDELSDRLYEITYNQLITQPEATLQGICNFLELDSPRVWLKETIKRISPRSQSLCKPLSLPLGMCEAFNRYQERFIFPHRATALDKT